MIEQPQFIIVCHETGYFARFSSREAADFAALKYAWEYESEVTVFQAIASVYTRTEWTEFFHPPKISSYHD